MERAQKRDLVVENTPFGAGCQVDRPLTRPTPHRTGRAAFPHPALYKANYSAVILNIH